MRALTIVAIILASCSLSAAGEVNPDAIAAKLGYESWDYFVRFQSFGRDWRKVDSSKFTPEEVEYILRWARKAEDHPWPDTAGEGSRAGFVLLLKFKDPKTMAFVDKQLSRGWYWADSAVQALENTGELSLVPLAAKYLSIDEPSEPMPRMQHVIYSGAPSGYAAEAISFLLWQSYQSPDAIKKTVLDKRIRSKNRLAVYRRWWRANEDLCRKGDFAHLSSPLEYLTDTPEN